MPRPSDLRCQLAGLLLLCAASAQASEDIIANRVGFCPLPQGRKIELPENAGGPAVILADKAELGEDGSSDLRGNVRVEQNGQVIEAEQLNYNRRSGAAQVNGNVYYGSRGLTIEAGAADLDLNDERAEFRDSRYQAPQTGARGRARVMKRDSDGVVTLQGADYTTCEDSAASTPAWKLSASEITLDDRTGRGTAKGTTIRLKDIPVLYLPRFSFPIDDRRKTGFLAPIVGTSSQTGLDLGAPYYINIAPSYDATITPRYMSRRGAQLATELRYLLPRGQGSLAGEYLPDDKLTGERRYLANLRHDGLFSNQASVNLEYSRASDTNYFVDLDTTLSSAAATHLPQRGTLSWQPVNWFSAQALVSDYQTLDRTIARFDRPYARLPQVRLNASSFKTQGFSFGAETEVSLFEHDDPTRPEGTRYDLRPVAAYLRDDGGTFVRSELAVRYTQYHLDLTGTTLGRDDFNRTLPSLSLDVGQRYRRQLRSGWTQTLEPRLFYLYTPFRNQSRLPIFDSAEPDFEFAQLFVNNRYTGVDRVGDANQITLATSSRLIDPASGEVKLTVFAGEIIRFESPRVAIDDPATGAMRSTPLDANHSDFIAGFDYRLSRNWSGGLTVQVDPTDGELDRGSVRLRYRDEGGTLAAVAYRYRDDLLEQTDVSVALPLGRSWAAIGRYNYSILDSTDLEALAGLQYRSCCWAVTAAARRYVLGTLEHTEGIYLQFELTGLAKVGDDFAKLLQRDTLRSSYY